MKPDSGANDLPPWTSVLALSLVLSLSRHSGEHEAKQGAVTWPGSHSRLVAGPGPVAFPLGMPVCRWSSLSLGWG